jgi:hypothetical protein
VVAVEAPDVAFRVALEHAFGAAADVVDLPAGVVQEPAGVAVNTCNAINRF